MGLLLHETLTWPANTVRGTWQMGRRKQDLPEKVCESCGRPFAWRKKWVRVWDQVKYCSDACRRKGKRPVQGGGS